MPLFRFTPWSELVTSVIVHTLTRTHTTPSSSEASASNYAWGARSPRPWPNKGADLRSACTQLSAITTSWHGLLVPHGISASQRHTCEHITYIMPEILYMFYRYIFMH